MSEAQVQAQEPDPEAGPFCRYCEGVRCVADVELDEDMQPTGRGIWVCPQCCWSVEDESPTDVEDDRRGL